MKALGQYDTNLADSTYNSAFTRALQEYQTNLAKQNQEYGQLFNVAGLGEGSAQALNMVGQNVATNTGNLMTSIGNSQAAGTVGSANALSQGITGGVNDIMQMVLMNKLLTKPSGNPNTPGMGPG
jgi:hypothetical protein